MRAYSCIDSHGRWTEIPTQVQFSTSNDGPTPQPSPRGTHVGSDVIDIEERVTASDVLNVIRKYANQASRSDATTCASSPAQAVDVRNSDDDFDDDPDDSEADEESEEDAENELEELVTSLSTSSKSLSPSDTACPTSSKSTSRSDTTACAAPPAQALPQDVIRGQNPNDRSPSDRTDCAALSPGGTPVQPAVPAKPKPDADGLIWHPHPGYPNQERSEPDAQGRVFYKIHMTTAASQLPPRETDAQRAAKLIYRSVIKNHGNP